MGSLFCFPYIEILYLDSTELEFDSIKLEFDSKKNKLRLFYLKEWVKEKKIDDYYPFSVTY
jgi:hypothetical protein